MSSLVLASLSFKVIRMKSPRSPSTLKATRSSQLAVIRLAGFGP